MVRPLKPNTVNRSDATVHDDVQHSLAFFNASTDFHVEEAAKLPSGEANIAGGSLVRVNQTGDSVSAVADTGSFFDGGYRFARAMNYSNLSQLQNQLMTNQTSSSTVSFDTAQSIPAVEIRAPSNSTGNFTQLTLPTAPRLLEYEVFATVAINTRNAVLLSNRENNQPNVAGSGLFGTRNGGYKRQSFVISDFNSTDSDYRLRNSLELFWDRSTRNIQVNGWALGAQTNYLATNAQTSGVFFLWMRVRDSASGGFDSSTVDFGVSRVNLGTAFDINRGYNDAVNAGTTTYGRDVGNFASVASVADLNALINRQTIIKNYSSSGVDLLHLDVRHGDRRNANIVGI